MSSGSVTLTLDDGSSLGLRVTIRVFAASNGGAERLRENEVERDKERFSNEIELAVNEVKS